MTIPLDYLRLLVLASPSSRNMHKDPRSDDDLSLFCVLGCAKAAECGVHWVIAIVMGVMSASFGGLIRDTLLQREAVALGREIYVTAALAGAASYAALMELAVMPAEYALLAAMIPALLLRGGALLWGWRLPRYRRLGES